MKIIMQLRIAGVSVGSPVKACAMLYPLRSVFAVVVISFIILGCAPGSLCFEHSSPPGTWARNGQLEKAISEIVRSEGIGELMSGYGYECVHRKAPDNCADCYVCTKSVKSGPHEVPSTMLMCPVAGELLVQVEAGPGSAIAAWTYWKK